MSCVTPNCERKVTENNCREFQFDHIPNLGAKKKVISDLVSRGAGIERIIEELLLTNLVHCYCHRIRTGQRLDKKVVGSENDHDMRNFIGQTLVKLSGLKYKKTKLTASLLPTVLATPVNVVPILALHVDTAAQNSVSIVIPQKVISKKVQELPNCANESCKNVVSSARRTLCWTCANEKCKRVKVRPKGEELSKLYSEKFKFNFCEMGRHYGISDNGIRKWFKTDGIDIPKRPPYKRKLVKVVSDADDASSSDSSDADEDDASSSDSSSDADEDVTE
jgi:hypothetical protein